MKLQDQWKAQSAQSRVPSVVEILDKERKYSRKVALRNWLEIVVATALVPVALALAILSSRGPLTRLCYAAGALPPMLVIYVLWKNGRWSSAATSPLPTTEQLRLLRTNLERQRVLVSTAWRWYVLPIATVLAATSLARTLEAPGRPVATGALDLAVIAILAMVVAALNKRGANQLSEKIDTLDRCFDSETGDLSP